MTDGDSVRVTIRMDSEAVEEIDQAADAAGTTRSDVLRKRNQFAQAVQGNDGLTITEAEGRVDQVIDQNQILRRVMPSHWRSKVEKLFADDLRAQLTPAELELTAESYRNQAEALEDLAATHPLAPDVDLTAIVDDVLLEALEGAELDAYYEDADNRFEKRLDGVEKGSQKRRETIPVIQNAMRISDRLLTASNRQDYVVRLDADDLPPRVGDVLPEGVDRETVAEIANELLVAGVDPEDVPDEIRAGDPRLSGDDGLEDAQPVPSTETQSDRDELETVDKTPTNDFSESVTVEIDPAELPADDGNPEPVDDGETTQAELVSEIPAADGGRLPDSVAGGCEDGTMTETTPNPTDESTETQTTTAPAEGQDDE